MMRTYLLLIIPMLTLACQPPKKGEDPQQVRTEQACADWCEAAVPCSSYYAESHDFDDQTSCEESCTLYAERVLDELGSSCLDVILDDRECAAALTCEEFVSYEEYSFGEPPSLLPVPCDEEVAAHLTECYV